MTEPCPDALCDRCSLKQMTVPCPDCGEPTSDEVCCWCRQLRTWDALPEAVRDDLRPLLEAKQTTITLIGKIRTALDCGLREAVKFAHLPFYRDLG